MKHFMKMTCTIALGVSLISLGACRTYKEGTVTQKRVQISQEQSFQEYNVADLSDKALRDIAYDYSKYGDGDVNVTVTYDPRSRQGTAMNASSEAARIANTLGKMGMPVNANIMPVRDSIHMKALFSYQAMHAHEPDCGGTMPGLEDRDHGTSLDYKMGCSIETMMARQIARPKDLMGRDVNSGSVDARGISNQIEGARSGERYEALGGESASQ